MENPSWLKTSYHCGAVGSDEEEGEGKAMTTNWTEQERKIAYQNLLERCQDFGDFDQVGDEVLEAAGDLSCERNALRDALEKFIKAEEDGKYSFERFSPLTNEARKVLAKCK
jgi:hypothetical protein